MAEQAAQRAGCATSFTREQRTPSVRVDRFDGCTADRRVELWIEQGAGHTWAGVSDSGSRLGAIVVGPTDLSIDASVVALDFFDSHR